MYIALNESEKTWIHKHCNEYLLKRNRSHICVLKENFTSRFQSYCSVCQRRIEVSQSICLVTSSIDILLTELQNKDIQKNQNTQPQNQKYGGWGSNHKTSWNSTENPKTWWSRANNSQGTQTKPSASGRTGWAYSDSTTYPATTVAVGTQTEPEIIIAPWPTKEASVQCNYEPDIVDEVIVLPWPVAETGIQTEIVHDLDNKSNESSSDEDFHSISSE